MVPEISWSGVLIVTLQAQCLPCDDGCDLVGWGGRVFEMAKSIIWPCELALTASDNTSLHICCFESITVGDVTLSQSEPRRLLTFCRVLAGLRIRNDLKRRLREDAPCRSALLVSQNAPGPGSGR